MKNIYEIQQFLKRFGIFIYVGDRIADLELMEAEMTDLYQSELVDIKDYQKAILLIRHELQLLKKL